MTTSSAEDPRASPPDLAGQIALVTGSNRGLGEAIANLLADAGATTLRHARTEAGAAAESGGGTWVWGNLATAAGVENVARETLAATDSLHILVNNAAINPKPRESLAEADRVAFQEAFDVNAVAPMFLTRALAPALRRARPKARIAMITSHVSRMSGATDGGYYSYRVSKAALNMITRLLAADLGEDGIRVNAIHPGWFQSGMGGDDAPMAAECAAAGVMDLLSDGATTTGGLWMDGEVVPW